MHDSFLPRMHNSVRTHANFLTEIHANVWTYANFLTEMSDSVRMHDNVLTEMHDSVRMHNFLNDMTDVAEHMLIFSLRWVIVSECMIIKNPWDHQVDNKT